MNILQTYAPTSSANEKFTESFHIELEKTIRKIPNENYYLYKVTLTPRWDQMPIKSATGQNDLDTHNVMRQVSA